MEEFLSIACRSPCEPQSQCTQDESLMPSVMDETCNSLQFSVLSRSFHNGGIDGRFSFMGDDDGPETQPETQPEPPVEVRNVPAETLICPKPTRTRTLFSHEEYEAFPQSHDISGDKSSSHNSSLIIVVDEEDLPAENQPPVVNQSQQPREKIFKTEPSARVPIYKTILKDWASNGDESLYQFVSDDPPGTSTAKKRRGRPPGSKTRKFTERAPKKIGNSRRTSNGISKWTSRLKKLPLKLTRTITKRPSKSTAKEAKAVFGLNETPPFDAEIEVEQNRDQEMVEVDRNECTDDAKLLRRFLDEDTLTDRNGDRLSPEFVRLRSEIEMLNGTMTRIMQGIRKL